SKVLAVEAEAAEQRLDVGGLGRARLAPEDQGEPPVPAEHRREHGGLDDVDLTRRALVGVGVGDDWLRTAGGFAHGPLGLVLRWNYASGSWVNSPALTAVLMKLWASSSSVRPVTARGRP